MRMTTIQRASKLDTILLSVSTLTYSISAEDGSPFHQFIQSTKDDHEVTLELKWYTLAIGELFVRKTQADEYKAVRYYQIEAMLANALGALHEDCDNSPFHAMQWWAFEPDDTNVPWLGANGRCSLEDVWTDHYHHQYCG